MLLSTKTKHVGFRPLAWHYFQSWFPCNLWRSSLRSASPSAHLSRSSAFSHTSNLQFFIELAHLPSPTCSLKNKIIPWFLESPKQSNSTQINQFVFLILQPQFCNWFKVLTYLDLQNIRHGLPSILCYTTIKEKMIYSFSFRTEQTCFILQSFSLTQVISSENLVISNQPQKNMNPRRNKNFSHNRWEHLPHTSIINYSIEIGPNISQKN
jgi:hypothetical protein